MQPQVQASSRQTAGANTPTANTPIVRETVNDQVNSLEANIGRLNEVIADLESRISNVLDPDEHKPDIGTPNALTPNALVHRIHIANQSIDSAIAALGYMIQRVNL